MEKEIYYAIHEAIQVMEHYNNGEDFALVSSLRRMHELEQKLQQHSVMQAEGSDVSEGAAVASSAAGQNGSDGIMKWCDSCGKITKWIDGDCENYKMRGGSAKGVLPRIRKQPNAL